MRSWKESTVRISTRCREERNDCVRIMREREIEYGREEYDNKKYI